MQSILRNLFHSPVSAPRGGVRACAAAACLLVFSNYVLAADAPADKPVLAVTPAAHSVGALGAAMLSAATAGKRIVSVGDHGAILLSDDNGEHYRQAASVPISSMLTSVVFVDDKTGWAVGQWGAILRTDDAGETWRLQRVDIANDRPFFSVYFKDKSEGWAVGLWSLMLHTSDGGATWKDVALPPPPGSTKADVNLYGMFPNAKGELFISAEKGFVLRSADNGTSWTYLPTGYAGSFWSGTALRDGTLLVGGLRGSIYRSSDDGQTWSNVSTSFHSSVNGIIQRSNGTVLAVALDGVSMLSNDDGKTFGGAQRSDRLPLTAAAQAQDGRVVLFSDSGPVKQ
ncbi:glycosyl hydrolase [Paraburkholderia madseniana]|uniref:Glycosyl hydrolase n=1 Tax=Paraburkholderia madseniana TaxID=2599607 RepID=A0A6N6W5T3_9BURK|nr:glycosyl hydrolase [Paraburkholderia madseniana]